jgi:hypothetical protein
MTTDLGQLIVEAGNRLFTPPKTRYPLAAVFGEEIRLLGYDLEPAGPGQFDLTLVWQAASLPADSYTVFVHLLDENGQCCLWQQDAPPLQGAYPTDHWLADEVVIDSYTIDLPTDLAAGEYPLEIGLYLPGTGRRLLVSMPGIRDNDALLLRPLGIPR